MLNEQIKLRNFAIPSIFEENKTTEDDTEARLSTYEQFNSLFETNFDRVFHYVAYRVGHGPAAEDLTAQVFLKAWEKRENYQQTGVPFIAWLFTIARNAVIDNHRGSKEFLTLEDDSSLESEGLSPSEECELHMEIDALKTAMRSLTSEQYRVVTWKYIYGLSTSEIALKLGKQEGTVRALQMRGLRKLADQLKDQKKS